MTLTERTHDPRLYTTYAGVSRVVNSDYSTSYPREAPIHGHDHPPPFFTSSTPTRHRCVESADKEEETAKNEHRKI